MRLTVFQLADLTVLLLEFLADLLHRNVVAQWFGHLIDYLRSRVTRCTDVVTLYEHKEILMRPFHRCVFVNRGRLEEKTLFQFH